MCPKALVKDARLSTWLVGFETAERLPLRYSSRQVHGSKRQAPFAPRKPFCGPPNFLFRGLDQIGIRASELILDLEPDLSVALARGKQFGVGKSSLLSVVDLEGVAVLL